MLKSLFDLKTSMLTAAIVLAPGAALAAGCGPPHDPGRTDILLSSSERQRMATVFVPSGYSGEEPVSLVLDLHGSNSNGAEQLDRSGWERLAEQEGFIVVGLQGNLATDTPGNFSWFVPGVTEGEDQNDLAYITEAIEEIKTQYCIDDTKIYASGFSGGARMLSQYLCEKNNLISGAAMISGLRAGYPQEQADGSFNPDLQTCSEPKSVGILAIDGLADQVNPYDGLGRSYWGYGAQAAVGRWTELLNCDSEPTVTTDGSVTRSSYENCEENAQFQTIVIDDGGHTWPGSTPMLKLLSALGKVSYDINATDESWDFFQDLN